MGIRVERMPDEIMPEGRPWLFVQRPTGPVAVVAASLYDGNPQGVETMLRAVWRDGCSRCCSVAA